MPEEKIKRRLPAVERKISEIQPERDIRVRILGTIIDIINSSLLVDDGTSKVEVTFENPEAIAGLRQGQVIRVIARGMPLIGGFACKGECVQLLEDFDLELYKKVKETMEKL